MDPIGGKPDEHAQVTSRPDNMSDAFLHGDCYGCEWMTQSGRHDAVSISCVNPKIKRLPVRPHHIVLIYSSLLSVRNCDARRFGDIAVRRALCI